MADIVVSSSGSILLTGPGIELARWVALKGALNLHKKGLKSRRFPAVKLANQFLNLKQKINSVDRLLELVEQKIASLNAVVVRERED